ncbi:MAG TPA: HD domain-containing phosphohydrolase [Candidatus Binatia bacterium]|nr:HD domain-containing phosphohydrolase [Candidatus Binatia bacterium]
MPRVGHRFRARYLKGAAILAAILILTASHFLVGGGTHGLHEVHIVLGGMYIVPIIAAALWFGLRGSLFVTALISLAYFSHIRLSWPNQPMENANQYAMIVVYWVIGSVTGLLVNLEEKEKERRVKAEREIIIESIAGLSNALRFRDEYTRRHSEHVARVAVAIGARLGLPPERLDILRLAGLIHDIGKIGIRDDVLLKPHELSEEEVTAIRRHPIIAAEILQPIEGAQEIASIVLAHHECPDGSGYPRGLKGDLIPREARIIRVADVFASLVEERPYKPADSVEQAMAVLEQLAGTKVDAPIFHTLKQLVDEHAPVM